MAGLYRRGVQRNAGTPMMQVQGSQGAGGAVPRGGGLPAQTQQNNASQQAVQVGGMLSLLGNGTPVDKSGFGLSSGVPAVSEASSNDVLGGLALNNNGMSYESVPPAWLDSLKNGVSQGWQGLLDMLPNFGGGAGA